MCQSLIIILKLILRSFTMKTVCFQPSLFTSIIEHSLDGESLANPTASVDLSHILKGSSSVRSSRDPFLQL